MSTAEPIAIDTRLHRVWGPPGCGKTTYLARQAKVAAARYGGERLVVASLTRAAAAEVAGRDTGIPDKNVGTLHAHAYRALGHPELAESKQGYAAWNDAVPHHLRIFAAARDPEHANPEEGATAKTDGEKMLAAVGVLRAQLIDRPHWPAQLRVFDERWCAWKDEMSRLDFTDLIERACAIPHPLHPAVVFLDEAQDMSALEMRLALHWATEAQQTVIVGDPDQCLFEWRGSSQAAFLGPDAESERVLSQSYRVPRAVHDYAVAWVRRIRDRPDVDYEPRPEDGSVETIWTTYEDPHVLVAKLAAQPEAETSMVLASCAYMLDRTIAQLRDAGVPFHNPYRKTNGRWNPLAGAGRILGLLRPHPSVWGDEHRFWTWDELRRWLDPLDGKGWLVRGTKTDVDAVCSTRTLSGYRREEVVPLDYFASILTTTDEGREARRALSSADPHETLAWWEGKLRAKVAARYAYPLLIANRRGPIALRETPRIVVGTIHSVKGGEADTVYVFPDLSLAAWAGEGQGGWAHGGIGQHPIIRLFYVAFTRARLDLRLCEASSNLAVELPEPLFRGTQSA